MTDPEAVAHVACLPPDKLRGFEVTLMLVEQLASGDELHRGVPVSRWRQIIRDERVKRGKAKEA